MIFHNTTESNPLPHYAPLMICWCLQAILHLRCRCQLTETAVAAALILHVQPGNAFFAATQKAWPVSRWWLRCWFSVEGSKGKVWKWFCSRWLKSNLSAFRPLSPTQHYRTYHHLIISQIFTQHPLIYPSDELSQSHHSQMNYTVIICWESDGAHSFCSTQKSSLVVIRTAAGFPYCWILASLTGSFYSGGPRSMMPCHVSLYKELPS